ncbi:putative ribonuclease H-like domain-containing protein [Tanacetum coccineum]
MPSKKFTYTQALKKVEAQLVTHQKNQLWYEEKIRFMKIDLDDKTDVLTYHKKLLAEAVKEKEELKTKLENFQSSSKGLSKLLNSQMSKRDKSRLGYGDQVHDGVLSYENEVFQSVFDSRSSDVEDSPVHDRFANVEGMHAVPPPMTGNYMPSGPDREIDDSMFTYGPKQSKTSESDTQTSNFDSCESNSSVETLEYVPEPVVLETPKLLFNPKVLDNPQRALKNKGIVDSGCSRHMTGNKAYLAEYQDYNGGPVAFGGSKGYITGKGKIKTGKLDFEDVCFVKELQHFNLFSVSQMCDKKNKVLFTDTECLVLSSDFKLPDENQVLLRIPRQNNMYSFNIENIVPSGGKGPNWLFDLDYLTDLMNYQPVRSESPANKNTGPKEANNSAVKSSETKNEGKKPNRNIGLKINEEPEFAQDTKDLLLQAGATRATSTNTVNTDSTPVSTASPSNAFSTVADFTNLESTMNVSPIPTSKIHSIHPTTQILGDPKSVRRNNHKDFQHCLFACFLSQIEPKKISKSLEDKSWVDAMQEELLQFKIQKVWILVDFPYGKKEIRTKWVYKNKKDERGVVVRNKARLVAQGHRQEEGIDYDEVFAPMARIEAIRIFLAFASYTGFIVYQMDVKSAFLYGKIDEEVYVSQSPSFVDPKFPKKVYVDDIIFGSTKRSWCDEFKALIKSRFQMSSMREITFFLGLQVKQKEDGIFISQDKSMIGSLMYLTASRPDIMYLKGKPKLGLWYPRVSSFDLEAYSDSDYARANLDRKSTTGGCQFLGRRLISWQVLWIQNQMLDYGFNFMNTKIYIDNESTICIAKSPVFHSKTKHIEIRHHFIRDAYEKKLI